MKKFLVYKLICAILLIITAHIVFARTLIPRCDDRNVMDILRKIILKEMILNKIIPEKISIKDEEELFIRLGRMPEPYNTYAQLPEKKVCSIKELYIIKLKKDTIYKVKILEKFKANGFNFIIIKPDENDLEIGGDWIIEAEFPIIKTLEPIMPNRYENLHWGIDNRYKYFYSKEDILEINNVPQIYLENNYWIYDPLKVSADIDVKELRKKRKREKIREKILKEIEEK